MLSVFFSGFEGLQAGLHCTKGLGCDMPSTLSRSPGLHCECWLFFHVSWRVWDVLERRPSP